MARAVARVWLCGALLAVAPLACARREPAEPRGLPGEEPAEGPEEVMLSYRPPQGARTTCPAMTETVATTVGPDRPLRQTLGGERLDVEEVARVEESAREVKLTFGKVVWTTSYPMPAPGLRDLPPATLTGRIDASGTLLDKTPDSSVTHSLAAWVRQFDATPGWPARPIRKGETLPRSLRGPGPPGTASTLEAAAPLTLVGYARIGGRLCAKFRSDIDGHLVYPTPGGRPGETTRSLLRGSSWLYFDLETGMRLGALHTLRYSVPPTDSRPGPVPEFRATFRSGPCSYSAP